MTQVEFNLRLVNLHKNLEYFAFKLTNNRDNANDLIQDTYYKALSNRDKYVDDVNLKAWTMTIMKNIFINNYRLSKKANIVVDNSEDLFLLNNAQKSDFPSADSMLSAKDISNTISKLSPDQRLPFEMYHSGYKYREIADQLRISIGTIKSRIFFSRRKLMNSLRDLAD